MLLTPHILTGVVIVTRVQNPILGLIFVLLSHYLLDLLPQKEYLVENIRNGRWAQSLPDFLKVFLDIALGLTIVFLTVGFTPLILAAAFLAILPDGLTLLHCILPINGLLKRHQKMHARINAFCENKKIPAFWGVAIQLIIVGAAFFFLR